MIGRRRRAQTDIDPLIDWQENSTPVRLFAARSTSTGVDLFPQPLLAM
jgi:hypothetical protein